jgi:hypothetical protein
MNKENRHPSELVAMRTWLHRSIGGELYDAMWDRLQGLGVVKDYLNAKGTPEEEDARTELQVLAKDVLEEQRKLEIQVLQKHGKLEESPGGVSSEGSEGSKLPEKGPYLPAIQLPPREKRRADALLKVAMRLAAERPDVKRFRNERLGGQLLLYDDTYAFISPGLQDEIKDRELAQLAYQLERDYGWRRDDAAWFVVSGRPPRLRPLTADVSTHMFTQYGPNHCEITIHAAPWIPSEVVERAFIQVRDQLRGGSGPGTVGERRLEVLRFVEEQRAQHGRRPKFEELLQMWNKKQPHWAYDDYRALSKAYREAYREVVYPIYQRPNATPLET